MGRITNEVRCPHCKSLLDGYTAVEGKAVPETGSISVCIYCSRVNIFLVIDNVVSLRPATAAEMQEFKTNKKLWAAIQAIGEMSKQFLQEKQSTQN